MDEHLSPDTPRPSNGASEDQLARRLREAAARAGEVPVPALAELQARAAGQRRRSSLRRSLAGAASIAAVALIGTALVWQPWSGGDADPPAPAADGAWFEVFEVPTYDWNGDSMEAGISGVLAFTDSGCTMLVHPEAPELPPVPVFFPDATGVRYENGVRAVADQDGRIFAIEGQEFSYGGGGVGATESLTAAWEGICDEVPLRGGTVINDYAAIEPLDEPPPPPDMPLPTRLATDEEQGYFEVPTFTWDPAQGGDAALAEGRLRFDGNCPVLDSPDGAVTGVVFPNAEGLRPPEPGHNEPASIQLNHPNGSGSALYEGDDLSLGGGGSAEDEWARLCGDVEVDGVFQVYEEFPG